VLTRYAPARLLMAFVGQLIAALSVNNLSNVPSIHRWLAGR
jgi:hypothetical protein